MAGPKTIGTDHLAVAMMLLLFVVGPAVHYLPVDALCAIGELCVMIALGVLVVRRTNDWGCLLNLILWPGLVAIGYTLSDASHDAILAFLDRHTVLIMVGGLIALPVIVLLIASWLGDALRSGAGRVVDGIANRVRTQNEGRVVVERLAAQLRELAESTERTDRTLVDFRRRHLELLARRDDSGVSLRAWIAAHAADPECEEIIRSVGYNLDGSKIE